MVIKYSDFSEVFGTGRCYGHGSGGFIFKGGVSFINTNEKSSIKTCINGTGKCVRNGFTGGDGYSDEYKLRLLQTIDGTGGDFE